MHEVSGDLAKVKKFHQKTNDYRIFPFFIQDWTFSLSFIQVII